MKQNEIWELIKIERVRQDKKWGAIPSRSHEHMYWLTVLVEEVGEVAKAIWEVVSGRNTLTDSLIKTELIHCAAVIVAWLEDRF